MTEVEAIKMFNDLLDVPCEMLIKYDSVINSKQKKALVRLRTAEEMAINALEKQIPIKPMISYDERVKENWCSCGVCCSGFGWKRTIHYKYCPDCGQKLDWSEE